MNVVLCQPQCGWLKKLKHKKLKYSYTTWYTHMYHISSWDTACLFIVMADWLLQTKWGHNTGNLFWPAEHFWPVEMFWLVKFLFTIWSFFLTVWSFCKFWNFENSSLQQASLEALQYIPVPTEWVRWSNLLNAPPGRDYCNILAASLHSAIAGQVWNLLERCVHLNCLFQQCCSVLVDML